MHILKKLLYFILIICLASFVFGSENFGNCPDGTNYNQAKQCISPTSNPYIPFSDSFEDGLGHWSQRKGRNRGAGGFETTSKYAHTGKFSVTTSSPDHMIAYDPEDLVSDKYFECWFYDDLAKDHASLCGVLYETADYMDSIMAGTETHIAPNKYTYHICHSPEICENFIAEVLRSSGWHQIIIANKANENTIYIDEIEVCRTEKVPDWRYVFAKVNDWEHEDLPVAYFDDLKVDFLKDTLPVQSASETTNIDTTKSDTIENPPVIKEIARDNDISEEEAIQITPRSTPNTSQSIEPPKKENLPSETSTSANHRTGYGLFVVVFLVLGLFVLWAVLRSKKQKETLRTQQHLLDTTTEQSKKKYDQLLKKEQELLAKEEEARNKREEAEREKQDAVDNKKKYEQLLKKEQDLLAKEEEARKKREESEQKRIEMEKAQESQRKKIDQKNAKKYKEFKKKMNLKEDEKNIPNTVKKFKKLFGKSRKEVAYLNRYVMEEILGTENKEFVEREVKKALTKESSKHQEFLVDMQEIDNMAGKEFEDFLEKIFTNLNYKVKRKKQTRDGGVDLVLGKKGGITVVQAKRYKITSPVGIDAVQAVAANVKTHKANKAMVITTSSKFTVDAQKLANTEEVELINRAKLKDLIRQAKLIKNG